MLVYRSKLRIYYHSTQSVKLQQGSGAAGRAVVV